MYFFLYMSRGAPHEGIPKNAFSTSCPEVEELYLIIYSQSQIPLFKSLKLSPYGKRT